MANAVGASISFGLRQPISTGGTFNTTPLLTSFTPTLASLGVPSSDELFSLKKSIFDWGTGSVTYCDSPVGIVRLNEPAMPIVRLYNSTSLAAGTIFKINIPYIVDDYSVTVPLDPCLPFTNYEITPQGTNLWVGSGSGTAPAAPCYPNCSIVTPYLSSTFGNVVTSANYNYRSRVFRVSSTPFGYPTPGTQYRLNYSFSNPIGITISFWMGSMITVGGSTPYQEITSTSQLGSIMPAQGSGVATPPDPNNPATQYGNETFILPVGSTSGTVEFNWGGRTDGYWAVRTGNNFVDLSGTWQFQIERICPNNTPLTNNITPSRF
jgi:hypothetical protein